MPKLRVAVVEDDLIVRDISTIVLRQAGHAVVPCSSGFDVLERCLAQDERFDVVVLDIVMPGISGLDVAKSVIAQPQLCDTRFVFISALPAALRRAEEQHGDMAVFLPKPYQQEDLLQAVLSAYAKAPTRP